MSEAEHDLTEYSWSFKNGIIPNGFTKFVFTGSYDTSLPLKMFHR